MDKDTQILALTERVAHLHRDEAETKRIAQEGNDG